MMPGGIMAHGRRRPRPGARPRARAVALDWGIFSQHFRGEFTQQLHLAMNGESYRLAQSTAQRRLATKATPGDAAAGDSADPDTGKILPG